MSRDDVLQIADGFRSRRLPCDVIWLDIDYMDKWQDFTWNRKRFRHVTDMMQRLHNQGFKVVAILDPGIRNKGNDAYKGGDKIEAFCKDKKDSYYVDTVWPGKCVFPDFARDDVQEWWADLHAELLAPGMVDGTWIDMNEPSHFGSKVAREKSTFEMFHTLRGRKMPHQEVHNVYGFLMAQAEQMAYDKFREQDRPFILTRAGFSGVQRYAAVWTGDNQCTWEHMKLSIPMLLGMGISGIALCGADIGGFSGKCSPDLFARWIQLGVFYPFCRNHAAKNTPNHEPWVYGDEITEIARKYLYLRYQLLPYFYDALVHAHRTGFPIMRALCLEYPKDPKVYDIQYEFLLGDSLLVAPVLDEGVKMWDLYLPQGEWVDFWTEEVFQGGKSISRPTPLDIIPLYVRKGAIIPMSLIREFVTRIREDQITLEIFPGPWTTYTHWEDDGWSKNFTDGTYNQYELEQETTEDLITVHISPKSTQFSSDKRVLTLNIHLLAAEPKKITLNKKKLPIKWDIKKKILTITCDWDRTKTMEFSVQL
jgi:alpha-glucosidase